MKRVDVVCSILLALNACQSAPVEKLIVGSAMCSTPESFDDLVQTVRVHETFILKNKLRVVFQGRTERCGFTLKMGDKEKFISGSPVNQEFEKECKAFFEIKE